jgi:hypothetical protein
METNIAKAYEVILFNTLMAKVKNHLTILNIKQ